MANVPKPNAIHRNNTASPNDLSAPGLSVNNDGPQPPRYTINLSLPPKERYKQLALDFKVRLQALPVLFDEIVQEMGLSLKITHKLARLFLRGVRSSEETEELRGIAETTGIELYLLVVFNNLLDVMLGCTSGGIRVKDKAADPSRMVHLRTLDWGMPILRSVVCCLDFVAKMGAPVICRTITYVGYTGVLTGLKKGLSISLNFRPCHDSSTRLASLRFHLHQILVLFGFRQSISSHLRQCLLPPTTPQHRLPSVDSLASAVQYFSTLSTTAAYVIFCDGDKTVVMEKDRAHAVINSSDEFIVVTNHDVAEEKAGHHTPTSANLDASALQISGMDTLVEESIDRKAKIRALWEETFRRRRPRSSNNDSDSHRHVRQRDVVRFVRTYPTSNEETHFAAIMDPRSGEFTFVERYSQPISS